MPWCGGVVAEPVRAMGLTPVAHPGQDRNSMCVAGAIESPLPTGSQAGSAATA